MSKKKKPAAKKSPSKKGDWKKKIKAEPTPLEMAAEARAEEADDVAGDNEAAPIEAATEDETPARAKKSTKGKSSDKKANKSELNLEFAEEDDETEDTSGDGELEPREGEVFIDIEMEEGEELVFAEAGDEGFDEEELNEEEDRIATDEEVEGGDEISETIDAAGDELANTELGAFESAQIEDIETISEGEIRSIVESVLFSTDKPISIALIKQVFKGTQVKSKDIREALTALSKDYLESNRGFTLDEIAGGFQLRTKPENVKYLRQSIKARPFRLSGPALEVLSIVAYKQPTTKHQIDEIRGVESGHLLRALMEKHLLTFGERSDLPGKPMFYETTRKFLEIFGLRNIAELPSLHEIDQLIPEGIGEPEAKKEKLSDITGELSTQVTDSSYSVGEDELLKITDELSHITTSSDFFEQEKQRMRDKRDADRAQDIREKMIVGEAVETKDVRWLERFDQAKAEGIAQSEEVDFVTDGMEAAAVDADGIRTSTDATPVADEVAVTDEVEDDSELSADEPEQEL